MPVSDVSTPVQAEQPGVTPGRVKNRWLIAASAVGIHICIGSVYAYSVMTTPVSQLMGASADEVKVSFSIAIAFLGLSAAFLGHFVEKKGPRASGMLAAACYGLGLVGAGVAVYLQSLWLFYLTYGVLGGIGLGVGYITPVSTLVKWFPDKRGLATGLAIMGFGFASMIAAPIMAELFLAAGGTAEAPVYTANSVARTFLILGCVYGVVMFLSAQYLAPPPKGWQPAGFDAAAAKASWRRREDLSQLTANQSLGTRRFYFMWLMLFINVTCGIAVISVASPMARTMLGFDAIQAGFLVGLIGVFNGLGRIMWSSASDYLGRPLTFTLFFVIQIAAFALLPNVQSHLLFQVLICLILTCYGGGFATVPAFLGDLFGTKQLGAIHGYTLTAWAAAGVVGPSVIIPLVKQFAGTADTPEYYAKVLYVFAGLFVVALVVSVLMMLDIKAKRRASQGTHDGQSALAEPA
ncbi:MAG: OFA family MFS transporter [Phycisphaerae bacterium]